MKFLCAFLIVCIHVPFPGEFGAYITALARIGVPIFFMVTGYFYTDAVKKGGEIRQIKKILKLVIEANFLYFAWDLFLAIAKGNISGFLSILSIKSMLKFLLLNESPFKGHLWYLGAILYVLAIVYIMTPILLLGDLILGKYSIVLWEREFPYILVRNFLFVGIPYFSIGLLIRNSLKREIKMRTLAILITVFTLTTLLERFILVSLNMNTTRDHYISTTFLAVAVFLLFKEVYSRHRATSVERRAAKIGRDYSAWIYIIHPIFITVIGIVMRKSNLYEAYRYIAPIIVYMASIIFVMIVCEGWKRVLCLRRDFG